MRIGILGSGLMGAKLGTIFARAGHAVTFSYSHSARKLATLARDAGNGARAGTPLDAASDADVVLLAVYWSSVADVLAQAGDLAGKVVLTCMVPFDDAENRMAMPPSTSGAEELARMLPGSQIVCAFNTVPSEVLYGVAAGSGSGPRPSLVCCGDDAAAMQTVRSLISDAGFDPVDAGPLRSARYTEPFAMLVARLAYGGTGGPALSYRFESQ